MKVIPKLQQGNTIESDNTKVVRPEIHEPIKAKPRQYSIVDLGGEPSNDTRSAAERNRDYWHPIKGARDRFKASMSNETNPLVGIERTILPSAAGAALVTTPAAVVGGALGNMTVDKLTGGWGNWLENKTGIPSEIGIYTNPGAWYGGAKGYKIGKDKLITKSIKGDADLAWNPINKNHWIFNKEARTPSNIVMATANRIAPFLSKVEKLPLKVAAYNAAKRTNGNASVSMQDIKTMPAEYTGSAILGGGNLEGRNLLAKYIFDENPIVRRAFFNKDIKNIKPISKNESKRSFSHGDRYEQLYPGIHNRRYEMRSVVPQGRPLKFKETSEFTEYAGKSPVNKILGKEGDMVMRVGDNEFMTFRTPGTNYVGPIDDIGGHLVKFQMDKGKLKQTSQDMWKFNPADYAKRWGGKPVNSETVRVVKQAALMDKVGRPFILQQSNPIWIEGKSIRDPKLVTMAHGGRFDFKKSPILKKQEELSGKRDMRKKFIKSSRPTYKKRIKKAQQGMRFVSYNPVSNPTIDYTDITNPINPFSEYNYNTTYDKPTALVVPVRDTDETDVVANNHTVEPVINKPVASKSVTDKPVTKTANSTWKSPYTNRRQWSTELINAYKKAGITNDNAIRMLLAQDALESSWGRSAQGKYNFGNLTTGSSWKGDYVTGNDKNAKGEAIKQKFRSYNSMDEYAADKIQFLKRLYDFDENDDINKFVAKLTGSNKGKRRYAEAKEYANSLRGVYNSFKAGGIIKYQEPAQPINRSAIRTDEDKNVPKRNRAIYSTFDATWNTPPWYVATAKAARAAYKQVANPDEMDYIVTDSVADAGWRKRLGLSYDSKFLPSNEDGSVRLPSDIEAEIPVDTTLLKDRIARETKIAESKNIMGKDWQLVTGLINLDKQNLDSLRKTYNTGEPTVLNEYSHNSRNLIKNGRLINGAHEYNTPLNILKNYTVQYDSKNRTMNYRDIYDFNGYEWAIPGKKFNIRGSINLDKK